MSHTQPTASSSSSSSNFQLIINNALDKYKKRTKNDLRVHPLATRLQTCNSPAAIIAILQEQVQGLDQSQSSDERWSKWLDPTVNVLQAFSSILQAGASMAFPPANVIFAGVGVLLSTLKDVRASKDTVVDIFERIERFFRRVEVYTEAQPTSEMMDIIVQIMIEVLSILGIATKEIKQSRLKKFAKKLIGRTDLEDGLKKLDKLTHEEAWMGIAQNLKATHVVGESVRRVADQAVTIDNRVAGVDGRVANVDDRVRVVDHRVTEVIRDGREVKIVVDQVKRLSSNLISADYRDSRILSENQSRDSVHKWLSPPDPSTNHNIACGTRHKKLASWFFEGSIFQEWKSTGSLLWVHGKPGSGKSVLCSTVIQDIEAMCKAGNASIAYFYFDFRDANKQGPRDLLLSLLTQLSSSSNPRCDILSDLYIAHDEGKKQPSDTILVECLKEMVALPDQCPIYLIIDALDESSNTSGIPSPRERVLELVKELVELGLAHLRICVTSRPEIDIRDVLAPLTSRQVSLHDQSGQKKDIVDYVKSVVYSNSEPILRRWKAEDKELVVEVLSERADGMFRWIFCQLETLRHCLPPSVRRTLDELPESLDETYERVIREIKKPNRDHALRLLQCLVVAIRPLRVEELAEVLAVDFDDAEGMPKLNTNWRWEDQEQALLSSCSSLIAVVESDESRIVQFSHFSVKEFLTSTRLATSSGGVSHYHIALEHAHITLAQACMSVLLRLDDRVEQNDVRNSSPLAGYAAEQWVAHVQFGKASSCLRKAMESLFDRDKPYFEAWLQLHDIDTDSLESTFYQFTPYQKSDATPLYYAALCGFQDLVEHLIVNNPEHVKATGGYYVVPLIAALEAGQSHTAKFLRDNGAHPNVTSYEGRTPLHSAAWNGEFEMIQVFLEYKADVNAQSNNGETPLHFASRSFSSRPNLGPSLAKVARLLLEHGADVNALRKDRFTVLHIAAQTSKAEVVRVLLEYGADVGAETEDGETAFQLAREEGGTEIMKLLSEHGSR
ncbi:hypothetical protein F5888DRAFT_1904496 [Russula emetica]|nr:hypothetical protein F5888DRAFT_1904496 [Russula emetica]